MLEHLVDSLPPTTVVQESAPATMPPGAYTLEQLVWARWELSRIALQDRRERSRISLRERVVLTFTFAYVGMLAVTVTMLFLQGFHLLGFALDGALLHWLGLATVGQIGGLAFLVVQGIVSGRAEDLPEIPTKPN